MYSPSTLSLASQRIALARNIPMVEYMLNLPYSVLLVILFTHFSYLFAPFLSNQTFSHHSWHICLLTHFLTLFFNYINHPNFIYIIWAIPLYLVNLFLPWNSNKYHLYSITSPLVHCKDFLGKAPSPDHTWAGPRPRALSWVTVKDLWAQTQNQDQMLATHKVWCLDFKSKHNTISTKNHKVSHIKFNMAAFVITYWNIRSFLLLSVHNQRLEILCMDQYLQ